MMRYFYIILCMMLLAVLSIAGLRGGLSRRPPIELFSDMVRQPKVRPQAPGEFFADRMNSRLGVTNTVARSGPLNMDGHPIMLNGRPVFPYEDSPINTGRIAGTTNWIQTNPVPITRTFLWRGQERFQISCVPCHGLAGDGRGVTIKYNMVAMANFHDKRLIDMADGEIFNTITHGKNLMGAYGPVIPAEDRWAIIFYIRALERSRLATIEDVPKEIRPAYGK